MASKKIALDAAEKALILKLVSKYESEYELIGTLLKNVDNLIRQSKGLMLLVHSAKSRLKESSHLKKKLIRKMLDAKKKGKNLRNL